MLTLESPTFECLTGASPPHSLTLVPHSKTLYLLLKLENPKVLYLLRTLQPPARTLEPPPLRVFGGCLATTRRLKSRPTLKFLIESFSYCCHRLIAFQPGVFPPFPSFYKTHGKKEHKKRMGPFMHVARRALGQAEAANIPKERCRDAVAGPGRRVAAEGRTETVFDRSALLVGKRKKKVEWKMSSVNRNIRNPTDPGRLLCRRRFQTSNPWLLFHAFST